MILPRPGAIDCDLHLPLPPTRALLPRLNDFWREQLTTRYIDRTNFQLQSYPVNSPIATRADWAASREGETPLEKLRREALDPFGTRIAVCSMLHGAIALFNEDMNAAIVSAVNDFVAAEWLDREPRLRGSILVTGQSAAHSVAEIERLAHDKRFVQVLLPVMSDFLPGKRQMWPIYAAAQKHGLAIGLHAGSTYRNSPTGSGWGSYQVEDYIGMSTAFENAIVSFIAEGVFNEFPDLRLVCLESGFTFVPTLLWRINKEWRGVRAEVPWIDRPPAEIVKERVRFTLQPVDAPRDPKALAKVIEHMGNDDFLLFSTDYPHGHFEGVDCLPEGLPDSLIRKILVDNPLAAYPRLAQELAREAAALEKAR